MMRRAWRCFVLSVIQIVCVTSAFSEVLKVKGTIVAKDAGDLPRWVELQSSSMTQSRQDRVYLSDAKERLRRKVARAKDQITLEYACTPAPKVCISTSGASRYKGKVVKVPASRQVLTVGILSKGVKREESVDISNLSGPFRSSVKPQDDIQIKVTCGGAVNQRVCIATAGSVLLEEDDDAFWASAFVGYAIDTFAAGDLKRYLNADESGDPEERFVGGFDFDYRLADWKNAGRLYLYGEAIHGVRSADVDCEENAELTICDDLDPSAPESTLYILRNATSLEAFAGARYEFADVNESGVRAALYSKVQFGFLTVADSTEDVIDSHHLGLGLILKKGKFTNSYLELGRGVSDLFVQNPDERYKIDGFMTWNTGPLGRVGLFPFAQITVDVDLKDGADSIQSYFGVSFDVSKVFGVGVDVAGD